MTRPRALLIDGSYLLARSRHSRTGDLRAPSGKSSRIVYAFASTLWRLVGAVRPDHAAICFDRADSRDGRKATFPDYKAQRVGEPDEDVERQNKICRRLCFASGLARAEAVGWEADDAVAALAWQFREWHDAEVSVASRDKDFEQLLRDPAIRIVDPYDPTEVRDGASFARLRGFPADMALAYWAIVGDVADNIPGVRGVGETGARKVLRQAEKIGDGPPFAASFRLACPKFATAETSATILRNMALMSFCRDPILEIDGRRDACRPERFAFSWFGEAANHVLDRQGIKRIRGGGKKPWA